MHDFTTSTAERVFDTVRLVDLASLEAQLEQERRSLAMLPVSAPLSREAAIALIERCQRTIRAARMVDEENDG